MYNSIIEKPNILYGIFCDFFGEEFVDMQGCPTLEEYTDWICTEDRTEKSIMDTDIIVPRSLFSNIFILVRFPEVRVTNENDRFIDIWELYAKVPITFDGKIKSNGFSLNRAEYDMFQFKNNYLHSHVSSIPTNNFTSFQTPCLGRGPIRATITTLATEEFDELRWQLFCLELSKYVQVESLAGGPYERMENLGKETLHAISRTWTMQNENYILKFRSLNRNNIKDFVKWVLFRKKLKFDFSNGTYGIGMSFIDWIIFISNEFIEWYNLQHANGLLSYSYNSLLEDKLLFRGVINNSTIYSESSDSSLENPSRYVGRRICKFKGNDVVLTIRDVNEANDNMSTFINIPLAEHIYKCILEIVNYEYGNNNTETQTSGVRKEVIFV